MCRIYQDNEYNLKIRKKIRSVSMMLYANEFKDMSSTENSFDTNNVTYNNDLQFIDTNTTYMYERDKHPIELNIPYTILEVLVGVVAIIGNAMVIFVFHRDRRLRRRTNYYIVSLAIADLLVGLLGIPFAILASIGLPKNLYICLFTVSLLVVLCTISIFCLVAVSVDRYWAILYPLAYSKNVSTKTAIVIISFCWFLGSIVGFLPLFGWHSGQETDQACFFVEIMDYNYLVFLYVATIITPAVLLFAFYVHIYTVIIRQVRQTVTFTTGEKCFKSPSNCKMKANSGGMLRVLGAARKREVKATQNLSVIVLFFMLCWMPLYTINCVKAFCPDCFIHARVTFGGIVLSHLNSAMNPLLYAYNLKDFRAALKALIYRMVCKEVQQQNINYRFSIASQQRIQALITKQSSIGPRVYVDSPVWRRQQQLKRSQTIEIDPTHHTKPQTAITSKSVAGQIWNIAEISSSVSETSSRNVLPEDLSQNFKIIDKKPFLNNTDRREYSFNYDHLDKDGAYHSHEPSRPRNNINTISNKSNEPKLTLSISLDNLNAISIGAKHDLCPQINLHGNVKLENKILKCGRKLSTSVEKQTSLPCRFKTLSLQNIESNKNDIITDEKGTNRMDNDDNTEQRLNVKDLFQYRICDENSNKIHSSGMKRTKSDSECFYDEIKL